MALTIDCQVHAYQRNTPERPWAGVLTGPEEVTGDDMVAAMAAVGVDGAILISPFVIYGYDASYALEVYAQHPTKFGLVRPFDPNSETIDADVEQWTSTPGVVGCRVMLTNNDYEADHPGLNAILAAGGRAGVPVNIMAAGKLPLLRQLAQQNAGTQIIIDHLGIAQPFNPPPPDDPFADLPNVLSCAELDNVAIKISGAGTLSHAGLPVSRHLGAGASHLRRLRAGAVPVGYRLDAGGGTADLRAGCGGVPADGHAVRLGPGNPDGWFAGQHLQVDASGGRVESASFDRLSVSG